MNNTVDDLETIRQEGLKALREKLGIVGMIKFIQMYGKCDGDYTAERRKNIDKFNKEDFYNFLRERGEME